MVIGKYEKYFFRKYYLVFFFKIVFCFYICYNVIIIDCILKFIYGNCFKEFI